MPSEKIQQYTELAARTTREITGSLERWTAFLDSAAKFYKYPFSEQLQIYAQRPDATACADYQTWNDRLGRYVRHGSKGIVLVDDNVEKPQLRYVFDISDTGGRRRPFLWEYEAAISILHFRATSPNPFDHKFSICELRTCGAFFVGSLK